MIFMTSKGDVWERTHYSAEVTPEQDGKEVVVMGWARDIRDIGKLTFLKLCDREGSVQITAKEKEVSPEIFKILKEVTRESVIAVKGKVKKNKEAPGGKEIIPEKIKIISSAHTPLPLEVESKKTPALLDTRLDQRVLDLRKPENIAIFRVQAKIVEGMQSFLNKEGFIQVFTPSLLGGASEGGADLFAVPFFEQEAFLRQDPQLHRELLICSGFDKIYDLGPSWRAERSHTIHHLTEHRTCAPEISFIRDEADVIKLEERFVIETLKFVKDHCKQQLEPLGKIIEIPKSIPELRFPKIYDILKELGVKIKEGEDLHREQEEALWKYVKEKYKTDFYFVNRFPFAIKPFYVARVDEEPKWARSVDLIYKGLELSSGGQREHRYDNLIKNIKEKRLRLENLKWFTDFFKFGTPPMGGFSLGIERLTMKLLDIPNIREAVLFPRTPERLIP